MKRFLLTIALCAAAAGPLDAQWVQVHEQFYLPADHNWEFRSRYAVADRLFNAFDYGHAILYEVLYTRPGAPASRLEEDEYNFITRKVLPNPPRVPLEEGAIEIAYAKLAPEAKAMFEWAHVLHRQVYDILAAENLSAAAKDQEISTLLRYYKSRPELAFSSQPKNMELMEGQYYSTVFRNRYPKFNGLIWGYHWLQVGLYEPLLVGRNLDERQTGITATVARFRQMLHDAPTYMPRVMPMTAAIAPVFAARYPEAAIIFDNLHSMHDVISDILASDKVPRDRKRAEILLAAARYRDDTSFVMSVDEWRQMSLDMGQENMGGPAVGFLPAFPKPTIARGAVMAGMDHGSKEPPVENGLASEGDAANPTENGAVASSLDQIIALHRRMLADPVILERVAADPVLRKLNEPIVPGAAGTTEHEGHSANADTPGSRAVLSVTTLLSTPGMEELIENDPQMRRLWDASGVQSCLREMVRLKSEGKALPAACPVSVPPAAPHKH